MIRPSSDNYIDPLNMCIFVKVKVVKAEDCDSGAFNALIIIPEDSFCVADVSVHGQVTQ